MINEWRKKAEDPARKSYKSSLSSPQSSPRARPGSRAWRKGESEETAEAAESAQPAEGESVTTDQFRGVEFPP